MRVFKWLFLFCIWTLIFAFFHYQLPRETVVRIVNTEIQRVDVGQRPLFWAQGDTGNTQLDNRDVRFIETITPSNSTMVFRNEDTGWGWPPYLKFDSANLQAEAANLISTRDDQQWVAVRRYGWRVPIMSIFPNALSVRTVEGPDVRTIPWMMILVGVLFFAVFWAIYVRWRRFRDTYVYPRVEAVEAAWDERRARRALRRRERIEAETRGR